MSRAEQGRHQLMGCKWSQCRMGKKSWVESDIWKCHILPFRLFFAREKWQGFSGKTDKKRRERAVTKDLKSESKSVEKVEESCVQKLEAMLKWRRYSFIAEEEEWFEYCMFALRTWNENLVKVFFFLCQTSSKRDLLESNFAKIERRKSIILRISNRDFFGILANTRLERLVRSNLPNFTEYRSISWDAKFHDIGNPETW